ncbi:hypothetical protein HY522_01230 [bacterium]|nr:hypothetical protein [bacterium]
MTARLSARAAWILILAVLPCLTAASPARAADTALPTSPFFIQFDTYGLPSSLDILDEGSRREDVSVKETARFLMIDAARKYFDGQMSESMDRALDGIRKGYYVLQQKRLLSRIYFMEGHLDSAIQMAADLAANTDAIHYDNVRHQYLQGVDRYLRAEEETGPPAYAQAAVVHGDEKAPHRFITPVGVKSDDFGRILLSSFGSNEVVVFSKGLEYQMKLPGVSNAFGLDVDPDGGVYVTSFGRDRVHRFKRGGETLKTFGKGGRSPGEFFGPSGIAVSPDRYLYVVDAGNHRIQKFSPDGAFLMSFGVRGDRPGLFLSPRSVRILSVPGTREYSVYVMSQEGRLLQRFDPYGNFMEEIPSAGVRRPRDFDWFGPGGILFATADGELVQLDTKADTSFPLMDQWGRPLSIPGISGLSVDPEAGLIYVTDQVASDLLVFHRAAVGEQTLLTITDVEFDHYPYLGINFRVTNGNGDPITGLSRRNFRVEEDNQRGHIVSIKPQSAAGPLNLVVHLDPSSAAARKEVLIRNQLTEISKLLPSGYRLSIRKGGKTILDSTDNPYLIRKSLDQISRPEQSTFVQDIRASIQSLLPYRGRRNILVLTSRMSDLPAESYAALYLWLANQNVSLFTVHLGDRDLPVLKKLCRHSGGSYRNLTGLSIPDLTFDLASSKTGSYFLVYASPFGQIQPNMPVDLVLRLFYLSGSVADRIVYYAPEIREVK